MWSADKKKLVYWYLLLNGQEAWDFYRFLLKPPASCISWQSDTGHSVDDYGVDAVIVRITTWKGALFSLQRIEVPSFSFLLEQQEFYFSCLIGMRMAQLVFVYFVLYPQNFIAIAMHMAAFNICHRSYHNIKRSFLPSSAIYSVLLTRIRSPCLLIDTYQYSQWYLVQVLLHVWKVARALLLLAAEVPSCAPPYANEIFNSKGAFPFLMRQRTAVGVGLQK